MTHERTTAENRNMTGVQIRSGIRAITESITTENGVTSDYLIGALDEVDDELERGNIRARNNEERSTARMSTDILLMGTGHVPARSEAMHRLIIRFYRPGDYGISESITRAIEAATK